MGALIPNIAKGRFVRYADLPLANDVFVWVAFTGTETDANLRDADHLTAVIATSLNEATFTGYSRQNATGVIVTVDDTNDRVDVTAANPQWSPTTVEALKRIGLFYEPDTTAAADGNKVPVFIDDFDVSTPTTGTVTYLVAAAGWGRAA